MSIWIGLVVLAQLLNAGVAIVDKYIVASNKVPRPYLYAFYVSILSSLAILVFAFSWVPVPLAGVSVPSLSLVSFPSITIFLLALASGYAFFGAVYALYSAFKYAAASDVVPVVGSISAIVTLVLSFFLLEATLAANFFVGFVLLVVGTFLVSRLRLSRNTTLFALGSGAFFAIHYVLLKVLFEMDTFDSVFFWTRVAIVIAALSTLLIAVNRYKLLANTKETGRRGGMPLIIGNKVFAGIASILILKATELGDVSLVQALGGLQFVFLVGFTAVFGQISPPECEECVDKRALLHKVVAVAIITMGFFFLFV